MADLRAAAARSVRGPRSALGYGILVVAPTGAGKTRIGLDVGMGAIRKAAEATDGRPPGEVPVLWLAPRRELVEQPVARLAELGWHSVRVVTGGGVHGDPNAPIVVASIQTLLARDYAPPARVVILDEARHYVAAEWGRIAASYANSLRIGLDATPARGDGAPLGDLFDAIVPVSSVRELTEAGVLVPSVIYGPEAYQRELCASPVDAMREWVPVDPETGRHVRTLVFCKHRPHVRDTTRDLIEAGIPAIGVDGSASLAERRSALRAMRAGTHVLVNCMLYTEGLDVPELEAVVIARGISHVSAWIQIGGRALRKSPRTGKNIARIIDLHGHFKRFGPLDAERTWHLAGKPIRLAEKLPSCVQCRNCLAWGSGGRPCLACGAEVPPPPPPKISKAKMRELYRASMPRSGPDWERWVELVSTQRDRGYSGRWASMRFKEATGRWPKWGIEAVTA